MYPCVTKSAFLLCHDKTMLMITIARYTYINIYIVDFVYMNWLKDKAQPIPFVCGWEQMQVLRTFSVDCVLEFLFMSIRMNEWVIEFLLFKLQRINCNKPVNNCNCFPIHYDFCCNRIHIKSLSNACNSSAWVDTIHLVLWNDVKWLNEYCIQVHSARYSSTLRRLHSLAKMKVDKMQQKKRRWRRSGKSESKSENGVMMTLTVTMMLKGVGKRT